MPKTVTPAQIAYEVYGMCRSNLSLLVWKAQTPEVQATWEAVAAAVLAHHTQPVDMHTYAASGGRNCPACGGADIASGNDTTFTVCAIRRVMLCEDCGAGWKAVYTLTGYEDLRLPLPEEGEPDASNL